MSIQLNCKCGRYFELDDNNAGHSIQCPACDAIVAVPTVRDQTVQTPEAYSGVQTGATTSSGWGKPQTQGDNAYDYNAASDGRERRVGVDQRFVRTETPPARSGFGGINAGIGGGLLMMAIAVIWFFGALFLVDRIFFYPPILFVFGLIAVFKGMANAGR